MTLEHRVLDVLSRTTMLPPDALSRDKSLASLGIGSLEQIECVMALEDELEVELPVGDLRKLRTVQDLIDAVRQAAPDAASS